MTFDLYFIIIVDMANKKSSPFDFIQKILEVFGGTIDAESERKRQLKLIAKELNKAKFKFYKTSSSEVNGSLGRFLYDLYKAIFPTQLMFNSLTNPNAIKNIVVDYCLSDKQKQMLEDLMPEAITAKASSVPLNKLEEQIKALIDNFCGGFDTEKTAQIEDLYNRTMVFKAFCTFDFYFVIKKFASGVKEGNFSTTPKFETISGEYIAEDLKEFQAVAWALPMDEAWAEVINFSKSIRNTEVISVGVFRKIIARLRSLRASRVLEMMVQHIAKDPLLQVKIPVQNERIVDSYLSKIRQSAEEAINGIKRQQKANKSDSLMQQIFGSNSVVTLKNYNEQGSAVFEKRSLGGYLYCNALNCLKTFLLEYIKKDVREYADLVLVRATWTTAQLSTPMSDAYHDLLSASDSITQFDSRLADDGEIGIKFKTMLPRSERDKESANIIKLLLKDANEEAKEFIVSCTKNLILFAKTTKSLLEDHAKTNPEMVINWKEVEKFAEQDIKELGVSVYKKIYLFVQLMQNFLAQ